VPPHVHLFTDADNTLWDTDAVFAEAQLAMLRDIERATGRRAPADDDRGLAFLRRIDQGIAATHPERLRYPPTLLAYGLELALAGEQLDRAVARVMRLVAPPRSDFADIVQRFTERLKQVPHLRKRVREGLTAVAAAGVPTTVVTEERLERCRQLLEAHRLVPLIVDVVSIRKSAETFRNLRHAANVDRVVMVGDQLDRDIRASYAAGFETFYFPGGFQPYWLDSVEFGETRQISQYDEIGPYVTRE
jgi:putative hydrolase of the HAD superfamily